MLSKPAFNALLKTLEEPPEHVLFILATTDADKLPATILSRVQQYHFHPISASVIAQHLQSIAKQEGFDMTPEAAELIAQHSRGGFRDSISLLDQLSSLADKKTPLDREHVRMSLGLSDEEHIDTLIHAYDAGDSSNILETLHALEEQGASPLIVTSQLLSALRKKLADAPHYVSLIQELIEVTKHPHPDLRLVTALLPPAPRAQTSAPAPAREASLKPKDKEPRPSEPEPEKPASKTKVTPAEPTPPAPKKTAGNAPVTLDWQAVLDKTKEQSLGLFSLVSRCDHEYTDGVVTIYAGSSFTWKKLDDAKNRSMIHELIQTIADSVEIVIKNGKKPSADERIRAVTAIMGGGEEVKLEDDA